MGPTNDDLARWGEPPADDAEMAMAETLADRHLREVDGWLGELTYTVLERAGLLGALAASGLRLAVSRMLPDGRLEPVASTRAVALRDLRRADAADRVVLRTGERVRVEAVSDRAGYLAVLNVGPTGNLNLLHPAPGRAAPPVRPGEPLLLLDVELVPPAGAERLYAVWTRQAAAPAQLTSLVRPGATLRDMVRVQDELDRLPEGDWEAVALELEHAA